MVYCVLSVDWCRVIGAQAGITVTKCILILSRFSPCLIEPDCSSPRAQEPTTCPCLEPDQSTPRSLFLLLQELCEYYFPPMPRSSHWFLSCWFPHPKTLFAFLLPHIRATYPVHLILLNLINRNCIWWRTQITKLLIVQFSPIPHCLHPLLPKYLPQHAILEQPQPMLLSLHDRPHFVLMSNNRQNHISGYVNRYMLRHQTQR